MTDVVSQLLPNVTSRDSSSVGSIRARRIEFQPRLVCKSVQIFEQVARVFECWLVAFIIYIQQNQLFVTIITIHLSQLIPGL